MFWRSLPYSFSAYYLEGLQAVAGTGSGAVVSIGGNTVEGYVDEANVDGAMLGFLMTPDRDN